MVSINKTIGDSMAGYDPKKAARMNALAQQYPKAPLGTLFTLANIPASEQGNYTTDSVGTRAANSNFGRVTSEKSQNVQSEDTPRTTPGSGSAFTGTTTPPPTVTAPSSSTSNTRINPVTGRPFTTPPTPTVTSPPASETVSNTTGSGTAFQGGGTIASQAFRDRTPAPDPFPAPPPPRPAVEESEVDFADPYSENFRNPQPIPADTRRPGTPPSPYLDDFPDDNVDVAQPTPRPGPFPEPPPPRPVESFDAPVDDFSGYPVTQVDDFSGETRNISQVDDFSGYPAPAPVDDFGEINTPAQVDDFAEYQPPAQVDDFGEINTPAQVDDFAEYQPPAQVDDFGEINTPAQVDDFADYSNNDFGAEVDDFGEINNPVPVDDFADYSDNDFGAEVDDFAEYESPSDVNQFGVDDFGDPEVAQFDEFGDPINSPDEVNEFGVDDFGDTEAAQFDEFGDPILAPEDRVENDGESLVGDDPTADIGDGAEGEGVDGVEQAAISQQEQAALDAQALKEKARQQQTVNEMREASGVKNADGDWRVKLRLAPQATYLYKDPNPGILAPLAVTDGIIFPYTPTIDVQYRAEYNAYSPTHSNYQHYFYKNSSVQTVQIQAEFTAQDTIEAEYLLACIHFLKSCSKMFYGQDAQRGSPPPLLYLTGLGEYQFNESPCAITEFNYNLPNDVNYIRARSRHINRDDQLQFQKPLATATSNGNFSALNRLKTAVTNAFNGGSEPLQAGAQPFKPSPGNLGSKGATYVPTKMAMTINLLPIVSRQAVSQVFSLKEYANGNLIKKGFW